MSGRAGPLIYIAATAAAAAALPPSIQKPTWDMTEATSHINEKRRILTCLRYVLIFLKEERMAGWGLWEELLGWESIT